MADLGGLGERASDALNSDKGEQASDSALDKAGDAASSATGGKADDKIEAGENAVDQRLGDE
jgi:hypothetical protein